MQQKIDFNELFKQATAKEQTYTKEETKKHISKYVGTLQQCPVTDVLHPDVMAALQPKLEGNMEDQLPYILMGELYHMNNDHHKKIRAKRLTYENAIVVITEEFKSGSFFTYQDVKEVLAKNSMNVTHGQWSVLRKMFPLFIANGHFNIYRNGYGRSTRWQLKKGR